MPGQGICGWPTGNPLGRFSSRVPLPGALALPESITPTQLVADANDWRIARASMVTVVRIASDAARNVTGIETLPEVRDGDIRIFENVGSYTVTFKHASASSRAENRMNMPGTVDIGVPANGALFLRYDGRTKAWRCIAGPSTLSKATDAQVQSAAAGQYAVTTDLIESASASYGLTDAATIAVDWDVFINANVTLTSSRILGNPTNGQAGTWRTVLVTQPASGDAVLTFANQWVFDGAVVPVIATGNAAKTRLCCYCRSSSIFECYVAGAGIGV